MATSLSSQLAKIAAGIAGNAGKATTAVAKPAPVTTTASPAPSEPTTPPGTYTPLQPGDLAGATGLDPNAQTAIADAAQRYATTISGTNAAYQNRLAADQAQLPLLANQYQNANLGTNRQMAGRGVFHSGLTQVGLGQNRAAYDTGVAGVGRDMQQAATDWQSGVGGATNDFNSADHQAMYNAAQNFLNSRIGTPDQYSSTYGINAAGAVPDSQNFASMPATPVVPNDTPVQKKV